MTEFLFTPDEAQSIAEAVKRYLRRQRFQVMIEAAYDAEAPYSTTLLGRKGGLSRLVEAQGAPVYGPAIKRLVHWLSARRAYCEVYIATHEDASVRSGSLAEMQKDGVGLIVVNDSGDIHISQTANNPALVVTPDPTLRFGTCKAEVYAAVNKFNGVNRKDGLRDMCELVERETRNLAMAAVRKGWLDRTEEKITKMSWASRIDVLASHDAYLSGHPPLLSSDLKSDLHSFRGGRNIAGHPVTGRRQAERLQRQFAERMMMGPRLVSELIALQRTL